MVLEATYGWHWAVDALQAAGASVHLAHPRRQPSQSLSPGLGHKIGHRVARLGVDTAAVRPLSGVIGRTCVLKMRVEVLELPSDR